MSASWIITFKLHPFVGIIEILHLFRYDTHRKSLIHHQPARMAAYSECVHIRPVQRFQSRPQNTAQQTKYRHNKQHTQQNTHHRRHTCTLITSARARARAHAYAYAHAQTQTQTNTHRHL